MTPNDIALARLSSQQLYNPSLTSIKALVGHMTAVQAQDYAMAKWAIGIRLPGSTHQQVQDAINTGEIIRTHVLRPTWHLVSADDIWWMLQLSGPRVKAFMKSRIKQLNITEDIFDKSNSTIQNALAGGVHLTRDELLHKIKQQNIDITDLRGTHFLLRAELDGIICSGCAHDKNQTYALLEERVPKPGNFYEDEALGKLAYRYFTSHGPATLADFVWWSGLNVTDAKKALEMVKSQLVSETVAGRVYWMRNSLSIPKTTSTLLLPAFDEFMISYADRSASIAPRLQYRAFTNNGIFKPVVVENGIVTGTWRRTVLKNKTLIEPDLFKAKSAAAIKRITKAAKPFGRFLKTKVELI